MNQTSKFSVRDICYAGLFAAVIAVMAQISIPMPLGVPIDHADLRHHAGCVVLGLQAVRHCHARLPAAGCCGRARAGQLLPAASTSLSAPPAAS